MSDPSTIVVPVQTEYIQEVLAPGIEAPAPPFQEQIVIDPEQARLTEQIFTQDQKESEQVQALMNFYIGAILLHDLAMDSFCRPAGEFEEEEAKNQPLPLPEREGE